VVRLAEDEHELVAAKADNDILGSDLGHEKAGRFDEDLIARLVAVLVVVALEAVDVDDNGSPALIGVVDPVRERAEEAAVEAPRERVPDRLLDQLALEVLAVGDVDEDADVDGVVVVLGDRVRRIENRACLAVRSAQGELVVPDAAVTLQDLALAAADLGIHDQHLRRVLLELLERVDAEHVEECGIGIEDVAGPVGDVDPLPQTLHQLRHGRRIRQARHRPAVHPSRSPPRSRASSILLESSSHCTISGPDPATPRPQRHPDHTFPVIFRMSH